MTDQSRRSRKSAADTGEPERIPAEIYYLAADVMAFSPQAAELLRSAAAQIEGDLRDRGSARLASGKEDRRGLEHLRLVI